jgi:hypothetical protein
MKDQISKLLNHLEDASLEGSDWVISYILTFYKLLLLIIQIIEEVLILKHQKLLLIKKQLLIYKIKMIMNVSSGVF